MKAKTIAAVLAVLIFTFCGCNLQTTMDLEYLQEEAFQKGYEQGKAEAAAEAYDETEYDSGYDAGYEKGYAEGYSAGRADFESTAPQENRQGEENLSSAEEIVCDYVLNTNSRKFHKPDCESVDEIKEKNKGYFNGTRDAVIAEGYEPCGRCGP
ncbi:MAG: hypothetical protein IJ306_10860 [Oscillospiraceae bacterium]|nr:hypothetical protein [Oscillospiraceae bacterium]